ncbi:helix-turn-helix transcriptional regulator [Streptomyces cinereoruber]|uniref:helix-turn-helix transcriptional regulator n=1 Tax=Streptomyces cinereoruber TaxID=67260 RepID=UPI003C2DC713
MVVTAGEVQLRDGHGRRRSTRMALIPSRALHSIHGPEATAVFMYCDPDSPLACGLRDRIVGEDQDHVDGWIAAAQSSLPVRREARQRLTGDQDPYAWLADPRAGLSCHPAVRRAMDHTQRLLGGPVRLQDLAVFVGLSASRLGHLFAEELGLPFPVYLRWARLRRAMELVQEGTSLTKAAHGAGFADSSHLTRVFHEMFGLAPSTVLRSIRWAALESDGRLA